MKKYLNEMENYDGTLEVTDINVKEDENGLYAEDAETAKWWQDLYNAFEFLKDEREFLESFNEYQDVIDKALEMGM